MRILLGRTIRLWCAFLLVVCKKSFNLLRLPDWKWRTNPENFNHYIDIFSWLSSRDYLFAERGVMSALPIHGGDVLELGCGDGFNTKYFFSIKALNIVACDYDAQAIEKAKKEFSAPNIRYIQMDLTKDFPEGSYDNVISDATLQFFGDKLENVIRNVKKCLRTGGVFSGTVSQNEDLALQELLSVYFSSVQYFETELPSRKNLYFWASK